MPAVAQPLKAALVVELAWYLPVAYAGRELARLGARVVPRRGAGRRPARRTAPRLGYARCAAGKESVVCDLKARRGVRARAAARGRTSCSKGSGPASRRGSGSARTTCPRPSSIARSPASGSGDVTRSGRATTSTTSAGRARSRTRRSWPPLQIADLAAGALGAVTEVLAALVRRGADGRGRALVRLDDASAATSSSRTGSAATPCDRLLTGGLACYGVYATADGRRLTRRRPRAEVLRPALRAARTARARESCSTATHQEALGRELAPAFAPAVARRMARALRR